MGEPARISFGTQSDAGRHWLGSGPRHINAYVEQVQEGEPPLPIYASDGLTLFATITNGGATRGMIEVPPHLYVLSGTRVVKIDATGTVIADLGGIAGGDDVFMARNNATIPQIVIISAGQKYVIEGDVLSDLTDTDLPASNSVAFSDQRIIYSISDGRIFWSDIDDATSIGALSFATAEGAPDDLVRVFAHRLDLWLFGKETTEIWRSTANADDPYQRLSGGFIPKGCLEGHTVQALGEKLFWVGDDDNVYAASGYTPIPIGHHAVVRSISGTADKTQIIAHTYYNASGHGFYTLTGPDWTWQYNVNTGKWLERESYLLTRWRARHGTRFGDLEIVGDQSANVVYKIDSTNYAENGNPLVWTIKSPPLHAYPNRMSVDRLHLELLAGVGLNSADIDESNPQVGLRWSDDGGKSFTNQMFRSLGVEGDHTVRVTFNNLGTTGRQGRIWEVQCSAPVARGLGYAAIEGDKIGT